MLAATFWAATGERESGTAPRRISLAITAAPSTGWAIVDLLVRSKALIGVQTSASTPCRTAVLGGHRSVCTACGAERITYNSCRNRHCPKCQRVATERWLTARRGEVLPIPYFHVVFTLPHALNPLAQSHPRLIYRLLFHAAASTLTRFGRDPRHLGGDLGVTAVLHTWGQTLTQHVHVHCVVTGGALVPDGGRWIPARPNFLFPVRALAQVFRGRYLAGLQRAFDRSELHLTGGLAPLGAPAAFTAWLAALRQQAWVVYGKPPFAGPDHVLAYLGRYTHRVAISNDRLGAIAVPLYAKKPIITRAAHEKVVADHGPVRGTTERTAPSADALGNVDERRATISPASAPSPSRTHTSANAQERVDVWGPRTSRASSGSSFAVSGSTWRTSIQGKW